MTAASSGTPDAWDEGDPYGQLPVPQLEEGEEGDVFVSEAEQEERRQQLEDLDERIASLQTDIAASEEALKALLVGFRYRKAGDLSRWRTIRRFARSPTAFPSSSPTSALSKTSVHSSKLPEPVRP